MMFTELILVAMMAVLYGIAWHNEPARAHEKSRRTKKPEQPMPKTLMSSPQLPGSMK